jgi:hypothetical protein
MSIESKLEAALKPAAHCRSSRDAEYTAALEALRAVAMDLSRQGLGRQAIYERFLAFDRRLQEQGRQVEQDILEDGMDILSGYFAGRDWGIP